jgi:hypothetical protein
MTGRGKTCRQIKKGIESQAENIRARQGHRQIQGGAETGCIRDRQR